jgi:hypothetical protein
MATTIPAQDELLRLTGTTGNSLETISTTANGTGAYYGPGRTVNFWLAVGSAAGTSPTLAVKFQDSATGDATSYTDVGVAFPTVTGAAGTATGSLSDFPAVALKTSTTRPYLRVVKTIGGTSAVFSMAVYHGAPSGW